MVAKRTSVLQIRFMRVRYSNCFLGNSCVFPVQKLLQDKIFHAFCICLSYVGLPLGLAAGPYHHPPLLMLDEATSALDIATEAKLFEALRAALRTNSRW